MSNAKVRARLREDFPLYAKHCLKIRDKDKALVSLELNKPQTYIHSKIEEQRAKTGMVRALILKGRKQGASTYIAGRFYHSTTHKMGWETAIIAHESKASNTLFGMAKRFHEHCPEFVKAETGYSNSKELTFPKLDGGYEVFTAGRKDVGRSKTPMLLHGSEVAFWDDLKNILAGLIQAVPDSEGTEIVLESTANGIGGEFHEMWQRAEAGQGDWIAIFVPWYWSSEYQKTPPDDFALSENEQTYARLYELNDAQMYWRRNKIETLGDALFRQEFPANASEAFQASGDSFIKPEAVMEARKANYEGVGPLVIGVDPARSEAPGADRFAIMRRRGRKAYGKETRHGIDTMTAAGWIKSIIDTEKPAKVFIDAGGLGIGLIDTLHSMGPPYNDLVVGVNFGGKPRQPERIMANGDEAPGPYNRKAEMWMDGKAWLEDELGVDIPDDDELATDICGPGYTYDHKQRIKLESKKDMAKRGIRSPDTADALFLTFAGPAIVKKRRVRDILKALKAAETKPIGWQAA